MKIGKRALPWDLTVEITRSFTYKLNVGNYESRDFFCAQKASCLAEDADDISERLYAFCKAEVLKSVAEFTAPQAEEPSKGSKEQAQAVAQEKLTQLKKRKPSTPEPHRDHRGNIMPDELVAYCRALDKDIKQFGGMLAAIRRRFAELRIDDDEWKRVSERIYPLCEISDPAVLKGVLYDLWKAMEEAKEAA